MCECFSNFSTVQKGVQPCLGPGLCMPCCWIEPLLHFKLLQVFLLLLEQECPVCCSPWQTWAHPEAGQGSYLENKSCLENLLFLQVSQAQQSNGDFLHSLQVRSMGYTAVIWEGMVIFWPLTGVIMPSVSQPQIFCGSGAQQTFLF